MTDALPFTETTMARALVRTFGRFPPRRYLAVENVSWGLLPWEADLLVMSADGYLQEVEIKISVADLRRDMGKRKHRQRKDVFENWNRSPHTWIRRFWYAMPEEVWDKVKAQPPIPDDAGVIIVRRSPEDRPAWQPQLVCEDVRKAKLNKAAKALTDSEKYDLARLGVLRYWNRVAA